MKGICKSDRASCFYFFTVFFWKYMYIVQILHYHSYYFSIYSNTKIFIVLVDIQCFIFLKETFLIFKIICINMKSEAGGDIN